MNMVGGLTLVLSVLGGVTSGIEQAEPASDPAPLAPAPLFESEAVLSFTLFADFKALKGDREQDSEDRPARLEFESGEEAITLQIRTRGNFRLKRETCRDMPPLRLNFPKKAVRGTVFEGQDKLKLVTHCRNHSNYEQNTLQEYLVYRMYNLVTDISFQARLVRVTYVDSNGEEDDIARYGFLIESEKAIEERLNVEFLEPETIHPASYDPTAALRISLFQHMIGNTDWSMVRRHNVKLVRTEERVHHPIPYDFDWSGIVNARYAKPDPSLNIRNVRTRVYRGFCLETFDYEQATTTFQHLRGPFEELVQGLDGLTDDAREDLVKYIASYYEILDSDERVQDKLVKACRPISNQL